MNWQKTRTIIFLSLTLIFCNSALAESKGSSGGGSGGIFSVFLGPNLTSNRVANRNQKVINSYGIGFESGFGFEKFLLLNMVGLESGLTYLVRTFRVDTPFQQVETTLPSIELPLQLRFWPVGFFALSAGGYFTYAFGTAEQTTWPHNGPADTKRGSHRDIGFHRYDYGVRGGARIAFSVVPTAKVFFELHYRHSLMNASTNSMENVLLRTGTLMGGLQFQF